MKSRSQDLMADGFDKNVAEKMPKMKNLEEPVLSDSEVEPNRIDEHVELVQETASSERESESPKVETGGEKHHDVQSLIEDLHAQILASNRIKRALEMDLASHQKTISQLVHDNKDLRGQIEKLRKELKRLEEAQYESSYLKEENVDALERIRELQQELREMNEALARTVQERNEALGRLLDLESRLGENEVVKIKGRLKEREAIYYSEENRELQSKLEMALTQNMEIEKKYETLKRSFDEVKESLTLLRDSCKTHYYNLSETSE